MRILLVTQLFQPEPNHLKGIAFAKELIHRGHKVEVLTGFPNYPEGKLYEGYKIGLFTREVIDGVPIIRVPVYPSHDRSGFRRFLCYASFAITASLLGTMLVKRPDVLHVCQGPATLALPAMVMRILFGARVVLDIQDIWPDSVVASGMLRASWLLTFLHAWCDLTYRLSDKIVVLSKGYKDILIKRGVPADKVQIVFNWCDESQAISRACDASTNHDSQMSERFNVVFAGTMGTVQALDAVILAAVILEHELPLVQFLFIGAGVDVDRLKNLVYSNRLTNVRFMPRVPVNEVGAILSRADALLIHLKDDPLGLIGIPQKTQAYMAAERPILMAVRGEAAEMVRHAGAGLLCQPEDPTSIADAVRQLYLMSPEQRSNLGANGRRFYDSELSFKHGICRMLSIFEMAVGLQ
jgi:glycosyltransferase involved in cell wall biosynthesis